MAKVYLISPPYRHIYKKMNLERIGVLQPPIGLAYIASFLKSRGHSVKLFDGMFSKKLFKEIKAHIDEFKPDFVGITVTTPQVTYALRIAEYIKTINPLVKIILGGPHASALPEETISNQNLDLVVCGEGEITMSEIIENKDLDEIKGICFRENGRAKINPQRPLIEDLDSIPFPLFEQLPLKRYYYVMPDNSITVLSGRGCPYRCSFCASGVINQHRYRTRSPSNFVEELDWIYKRFGIKSFNITDETFTINHNRVEKICELILEKGLPIKWCCTTRPDRLTKQILKIMKASGCEKIGIGIESADYKVLKATGKSINLEQVADVVLWANELRIKVAGYFLLGLPYESESTLEKTLKFSKGLKLDYAHFTMLVPLPGTPIWDMVKEGKILRCKVSEWSDYSRYNKAIVESDFLPANQLLKYQRRMVRNFYLNAKFIYRSIRKINSFKELSTFLNKGVGIFKIIIT